MRIRLDSQLFLLNALALPQDFPRVFWIPIGVVFDLYLPSVRIMLRVPTRVPRGPYEPLLSTLRFVGAT